MDTLDFQSWPTGEQIQHRSCKVLSSTPARLYLRAVFVRGTDVGQTVDVDGQLLRHGEHLNRESTHLGPTINREPVERLVNGTAGKITVMPSLFGTDQSCHGNPLNTRHHLVIKEDEVFHQNGAGALLCYQ